MIEVLIPVLSDGFIFGLAVGFMLGAMFALNLRPLVHHSRSVSHLVQIWVGHVRDRT